LNCAWESLRAELSKLWHFIALFCINVFLLPLSPHCEPLEKQASITPFGKVFFLFLGTHRRGRASMGHKATSGTSKRGKKTPTEINGPEESSAPPGTPMGSMGPVAPKNPDLICPHLTYVRLEKLRRKILTPTAWSCSGMYLFICHVHRTQLLYPLFFLYFSCRSPSHFSLSFYLIYVHLSRAS
jgi:hypothetical protein